LKSIERLKNVGCFLTPLLQQCNLKQKILKNALALATHSPDFAYHVMQGPGYMALLAGEVSYNTYDKVRTSRSKARPNSRMLRPITSNTKQYNIFFNPTDSHFITTRNTGYLQRTYTWYVPPKRFLVQIRT